MFISIWSAQYSSTKQSKLKEICPLIFRTGSIIAYIAFYVCDLLYINKPFIVIQKRNYVIINQLSFMFLLLMLFCILTVFYSISSSQPKYLDCWTQASPKFLHKNRSCVARIQWLPTNFTRSSDQLVDQNIMTASAIVSASNVARPLPLRFSKFSGNIGDLVLSANLLIPNSITQRNSKHYPLHFSLSHFEPSYETYCKRPRLCTVIFFTGNTH